MVKPLGWIGEHYTPTQMDPHLYDSRVNGLVRLLETSLSRVSPLLHPSPFCRPSVLRPPSCLPVSPRLHSGPSHGSLLILALRLRTRT